MEAVHIPYCSAKEWEDIVMLEGELSPAQLLKNSDTRCSVCQQDESRYAS